MNIATKLIAGLVAGLVLTACSGGGSSGSSPKPNSESTPKVDMSAPKAEQPKKEEAPQADSPKAEKPKSIAPLMMENPKVEKQKENNLQEKSPKADEPQVMDPKLGAPQKDDQKLEEPKNKSNAEILKELGIKDITSGTISISDIELNLQLDSNDNVKISLLNENLMRDNLTINNKIAGSDIRTLKDSSGRLLGYYGYVQLNQVTQDSRDPDNYKHQFENHYLLSMNDAEKILPEKSLEYKGSMIYGYNTSGNEKLTAEVNAKYDSSTKKLSMKVYDNDRYWKLGEVMSNNVRLPEEKVDGVKVDSDGTINARLYLSTEEPLKLTPDANFSGGIFGKNGEVLAGKAESIKGEWQGVIGATATTKEDKK
ncbi:membrane protein [Actinobacillus pleuropneumoniae]|uniref:Outer membrane lipoprotein A n=2 Tax=Actinobacillus pleuropneumoniae TaxID=715 RepID=A3N346_ACTP2|nr:transferrin-binding protein-like solute binding protein [Actinobacillus pleuropneumoniae]AAD00612.1 outer membrane lipoprotein [Actinobacillus pleuropneumoniae]AAD00613.1 outer membrane lipoprotein [Actinobacillus pleuropneumoniae]ABN74832.1 Outer membrane lipoprotein A precursor [Actinobacillus pleuropneumoniae serovar 5b str. L20]MEE3683186.1 transferrin-binding protein-like solute binding protein [Actinobacillus pleuropneumoniae]QSZ39817.1 membrane protein [Actinobacillus pleuropneumonia